MGTESPEVRVQATPEAGGLGGQKQSAQTETGREGGRGPGVAGQKREHNSRVPWGPGCLERNIRAVRAFGGELVISVKKTEQVKQGGHG